MNDAKCLPLVGKVAIVTGAAAGMGEAIARTLAARGASIAICDVDAEGATRVVRAIEEGGGTSASWRIDVSDGEVVHRVAADVKRRFGVVQILVNNAGILYPTRFEDMTDEEWHRTLGVNLTGAFHFCKAVYPEMKKTGWGRIVNVSSSAGRSTSDLGGVHYTVSKAGLLGLTRHLAKEAGPEITVNAVCPGIIDTGMAARFGTPERIEAIRRHLPLKRIGAPQDVANLVAFLASDDAAYITGESIEIDGGELMI